MSAQPSFSSSPPQGPVTEIDESKMPQGNCRYILLLPEIKGQRCACVNFTLNKAIPSATCDCGHLACFHHRTAEPPMDKQEIEQLRQRVHQLEEQLAREADKENEVVARVSQLEGVVESRTEEISQEIKKTYGNLNRAWHSIETLDQRSHQQDVAWQNVGNHLRVVDGQLQDIHQRQCELNDADISLEERLMELAEGAEGVDGATPTRGRSRPRSTSDAAFDATYATGFAPDAVTRPHGLSDGTAERCSDGSTTIVPATPIRQTPVPFRSVPLSAPELWAVHISLLPTSSQPFPFERNTNAYARCLSRGLHQMVAVNGTEAAAFVSAVSHAFGSLLRGRPWMPLQAKLCDAKHLQGLPMLRPLGPSLVDSKYDVAFLRAHCAVLDAAGKIDSLYIAMRHSTLSWHALRHSPVHLDGLEASWEYDPLLDPNDPFDDDDDLDESNRPSAGDLVSSIPTLKRAASEISRSSSFGSATAAESEGPRPKAQRIPCPPPNIVEVRRQRMETA